MKTFRIVVYDRTVRHFEKEFVAESEERAREIADAEEVGPDEGWTERYEELFSECYIESVTDVTEGKAVDDDREGAVGHESD